MSTLARLRLAAGALTVLFALAALAPRASAQTQPAVSASPEELLLSLLPFRLQPAEAPAGFQLVDQQALTPARRAFDEGNDDAESRDALQQIQQDGFLTGFQQVFGPSDNTPVRIFAFQVSLYGTASQASAGLKDELDVPDARNIQSDHPLLPVQLGDESGAVHVELTRPNSDNRFIEVVVWRHGRLLLETELLVLDGTETLDQLLPFTQAVDRHATATAVPAPVAAATLPAFGDEQFRVDVMYALGDRLPGSAESPYGFSSGNSSIVTNSDALLDAPDPRAMYTRIATVWKRVVEVDQTYDTPQRDDGDVLHVRFALDADPESANANLLDPPRLSSSPLDTYSLPQPLGDNGRLYHESYTSPNGVPFESWRAVWTRGRVVLTVYSTGPTGDFSAQSVAAFAATVDARYNNGPVPSVLTQPVPAPQPPVT
jgi:hypothetical protein